MLGPMTLSSVTLSFLASRSPAANAAACCSASDAASSSWHSLQTQSQDKQLNKNSTGPSFQYLINLFLFSVSEETADLVLVNAFELKTYYS